MPHRVVYWEIASPAALLPGPAGSQESPGRKASWSLRVFSGSRAGPPYARMKAASSRGVETMPPEAHTPEALMASLTSSGWAGAAGRRRAGPGAGRQTRASPRRACRAPVRIRKAGLGKAGPAAPPTPAGRVGAVRGRAGRTPGTTPGRAASRALPGGSPAVMCRPSPRRTARCVPAAVPARSAGGGGGAEPEASAGCGGCPVRAAAREAARGAPSANRAPQRPERPGAPGVGGYESGTPARRNQSPPSRPSLSNVTRNSPGCFAIRRGTLTTVPAPTTVWRGSPCDR